MKKVILISIFIVSCLGSIEPDCIDKQIEVYLMGYRQGAATQMEYGEITDAQFTKDSLNIVDWFNKN